MLIRFEIRTTQRQRQLSDRGENQRSREEREGVAGVRWEECGPLGGCMNNEMAGVHAAFTSVKVTTHSTP